MDYIIFRVLEPFHTLAYRVLFPSSSLLFETMTWLIRYAPISERMEENGHQVTSGKDFPGKPQAA
jgi:hypothetical protein